ncbi:MAG: protoporphyrinogen oxidase [Firmicutes bacterium]|nr:protoporphyrinogen oxidase [Bacillota bacterium]
MRESGWKVAVVGGGLAGLSAAWRLLQLAQEHGLPLDVTVLEAGARLGGKVFTLRERGLVVEAGPDSFLAAKPAMRAWLSELGLEGELRGMGPRRHAYVARDGRLHRLPEGLRGIVPTSYAALFRSRLLRREEAERVLLDRAWPRGWEPGDIVPSHGSVEDAALGGLLRRRFGDAWVEYVAEPLLAGIHAASLDRLSARAVQPELWGGRFQGSWIALARRAARRAAGQGAAARGGTPAASPFLTLRRGLYQAVERAAAALAEGGVRLLTHAPAVRLLPAARGGYALELADGAREAFAAVILAVPSFAAARLVERLAPDAAAALAAVPYASTLAVALAYERRDVPMDLDGTGFLVPRAERKTISACTWLSSKWPHTAPPDTALLRVFTGRRDDEAALKLGDDALLAAVRADLRALMGIAAAPRWHAVFRWPEALPQYDVGHLERVAAAEAALAAHPGLALAGAAYRGVGLPDVVAGGRAAAEAVAAHLRRGAVVRA